MQAKWLWALTFVLVGCGNPGPVPIVRSGGQYDELLKEAESLSKPSLKLYEQGIPLNASDKANLTRARDIFIGLRDFSPADPIPHFALGKLSRALDDDTSAISHFGQCIAILDPIADRSGQETAVLAEAHAETSRIALLRNNFVVAEQEALSARRLVPKDPRYLVDHASVLVQLKRTAEARKLLLEALSMRPSMERAQSLLKLIN